MSAAEAESGVGKRLREALRFIRDGALAEGDEFQRAVEMAHRQLAAAASEMTDVPLNIATNRITFDEEIVYRSESQENNLAFDLFNQGLRRVTFRAGLELTEVSAFVRALAECRDASTSDVDFVSTLWQEELAHIRYLAIDGFTEKLFMAEATFTERFRGTIEDIVPGLLEMDEDDSGDRKRRQFQPLDDFDATAAAETAVIETAQAMEADAPALTAQLREALGVPGIDHLVRLHACVLAKEPQPLDEVRLAEVTSRILETYLQVDAWEGFAAAARSLWRLVEARASFRPAVSERMAAVRPGLAGKAVAEQCALAMDRAPRDFRLWARWFLTDCGIIAAPDLLALIANCEVPEGVEFLKDLLHRQGTASLDPWAERLKDPTPGVVLEVLEVILSSPLGAQARPLLVECLRHEFAAVRARAVAGLARNYDQKVREVLLPHLKDSAPEVRLEVLHRFVKAGDRSVAPYVASCVRSALFGGYDEDEQRLFFEALARLGGAHFTDVFRERLRLDGDGNKLSRLFKRGPVALTDDPLRRGALAGLARLGTPEANAMLQDVKARADVALAGHCDVVVRLAARDSFEDSPEDVVLDREEPSEDVDEGRTLMGDRLLFEAADVLVPPPARPKPVALEDADPVVEAVAEAQPVVHVDENVPLADRPLLDPTEVFDPADVRELNATPAISEGNRFRLTSPRAMLVGVETEDEAPTHRPLDNPLVITPIVERSSLDFEPMVAGVESRQDPIAPPAAAVLEAPTSLESMLRGYLISDKPAAAPPPQQSRPRPPPSTPDAPPAPPGVAAPRPVATGLPIERDRVRSEPVSQPPPRQANGDPGVAALLKDFLDLDLGD